jgi:DNA-binding NtrC family response regulator
MKTPFALSFSAVGDEKGIVLDDETAKLAEPAEEPGLCLLVVGPGGGVVHPLPRVGEVIIGRASDVDIQIDEASISRRHAELVTGRARPAIRDLESANGVRVGQRLLPPDELTPVDVGQAVELGSVVVVLHQPSMLPAVGGARPEGEERPSLTPGGPPLVRDPAMERLFGMVERIAPSELSVLLLGETGVGKEVVAQAIHESSARRAGPYLKLNCSALSENLVESELFGHVRGAFTGAVKDKPGLLEAAAGGTVFLDEIGELPPSIQAKLLRVLEERKVMRVGSLEPRPIDVRFVAATNRDLKRECEEGRFRTDLFFRLNGISLEIPPLRDRRNEIAPLAARFVKGVSGGSGPDLAPGTVALLEAYRWPGNVRELRNAVERAVVLAGSGPILPDHLPPEISHPASQVIANGPAAAPEATSATEGAQTLEEEMAALEKRRIEEALEKCDGNQTQAAKLLGMPRRTFVKRLDAYGIARPRKK